MTRPIPAKRKIRRMSSTTSRGNVSEALCSARQQEIQECIHKLDAIITTRQDNLVKSVERMEASTAAAFAELKAMFLKLSESILGNGKPGLERRTSTLERNSERLDEQTEMFKQTLTLVQETLSRHTTDMREIAASEANRIFASKEAVQREEMRKIVEGEVVKLTANITKAEADKRGTLRYYLKPLLTILYGIVIAALIMWVRAGCPFVQF